MTTNPLFPALLTLADDSLILGQRLCEWSGRAPSVEIDISLSNLALDLIGQATLLLEYAAEVEGEGRTADMLAFHRDAPEFRNSLLVEQPNGDFAQTLLRHFLFSNFAVPLYEGLTHSADAQISGIAAKAIKELSYHLEYSSDWVIRLGAGTEESHQRLLKAVDWHWRFVDDLFEEDGAWTSLAQQKVVPARADLRASFDTRLGDVFAKATLAVPDQVWPITGGRIGSHSEHLSRLLAEMQVLPRAHPEAQW